MELIGFPLSYRMTACLMVLEAAQVEHKVQWISFEDLKTEKITKYNPHGKIPILVTPEGAIYESMAIIRHVARVSGKLGGATPLEEALIDQWLSWTNTEVAPLLHSFWYQTIGLAFPSISYKAEDITRGKEAFSHALAILNDHLADKKVLVGNSHTIADFALLPHVYQAIAFTLTEKERNAVKNVIAWIDGLSHTPQFKKYFGRIRYVAQPLKIPEVAAPKKEEKKKEEKKKDEKKDEKKKEEKKKEEKVLEADDLQDPKPKEPEFGPTNLNLMSFKTFFINEPNFEKALEGFWNEFKEGEWSLWHLKYLKYPGECEIVYRTNNLLRTFMSRLDNARKYIFGTHFIVGDEPVLFIEGLWLMRGPVLLDCIKEIDVFDTYEWIKLDSTKQETKDLVKEYWTKRKEDEDQILGRTIRTFKWIK